jgi:ribosomal-protein-alanine N-acetyltransferase
VSARVVAQAERVHLRRPTPRDAERFLERVRASRSLHRPWVSPPADGEAFAAFVRRSRRADFEALLVCRNPDGAIAGVFDLSQIFRGPFRSAYLGFYAFEPFAGQGIMHDGIRLVLRYAFGTLGLHRLQANVQPGNEASLALIRGAGFRREGYARRYLKIGGRWRDHEMWAVLAEDLRGQPSGRATGKPLRFWPTADLGPRTAPN